MATPRWYVLLSVLYATTLCLSGCVWAPGQHMRAEAPAAEVIGNDHIDIVEITSDVLAGQRAALGVPTLPVELTSFQPEPYRIGIGDLLYITVWDHPELTVPAGSQQQINAAGRLVQSDGALFYPYLGHIEAAGKTPRQLRDVIAQRLARFVESPQVDVAVLSYASQRVWVTGAAERSGVVPLTVVPLTLDDAISQAGLNPNQADLSGVRLTRDGHTYVINLDQPSSIPIYLKNDDRIYIPYLDAKEVFVVGEVNAPGALNFKTGAISLSQALGRSQGLSQTTARGDSVYVIRGSGDLQQRPSEIYQLKAKSPATYALASEFRLIPGDVVFVGAAGITRWNRFIAQLLPFSGLISTAAATGNDLGGN
jgi:polysaccharide biosynthesis/export protein